jgi:hypothetical protein
MDELPPMSCLGNGEKSYDSVGFIYGEIHE